MLQGASISRSWPATLALARHVNQAIADMVHAAPERFVGLGMVPLQDPELAAKVLREIRRGRVNAHYIARRLGVTHATAIKTITRLKREGLATSKLYRGVFLTPEGSALAAKVRDRHRLVVDLLIAIGVPEHCAELDAEGIEHHVSDVALAAFSRFLKRRG